VRAGTEPTPPTVEKASVATVAIGVISVHDMAQVVIRNLDDTAIQRLKERAARKGSSLERELRTIITEAARADRADFRTRAAALRRRLRGRQHTDSTELIREDRGR